MIRCGSRICQGGPQVLRPKVADVAKLSHSSEASNLRPGVQGLLKGPGSFWVFNAQICILPISRDSFSLIFDIISTPKVDKNRTLHCTSINLRHSYILHLLFNLHEKVMF